MAGPTIKTGAIAASEVWDLEGSPYHITGSITLAASVDIAVEAGVEIEVQLQGAFIQLGDSSRFDLGGTKDAPIHIHGQVALSDYWEGFRDAPSAVIHATFTTFEHASWLFQSSQVSSPFGATWLEDCICRNNSFVFKDSGFECYIYFARCLFEKNIRVFRGGLDMHLLTGAGDTQEPDRYIVDCIFRDNDWHIYQYSDGASFVAVDCKFYRARRGAVYVKAAMTGSIKLEHNWFGSDSGPEETAGNPTGTGDLILIDGDTVVDYTPWTTLGRYVPVPDDVREYVHRIMREGTLSGEDSATTLLDDESLNRMLDRAEKRVDRWMSPGVPLEKRFLGYGSETQEMHDLRPGAQYIQLRYRPIISVTLVEIRGGSGSSWSTVSEQESGGWYASEEGKRRGRIHLDASPTFEKDSFRVTYTHGYYDAPEEVRAAVIRLVALDVFSAILQPGEDDPYTARAQALREDIKEMKEELLERKRRYVVF